MRGYSKDVPGVSKPAICQRAIDKEGTKCGKPANNTIASQAEILGKMINLKLKVCDEHMKELLGDGYSGFTIQG